jgi:hypothetical protein
MLELMTETLILCSTRDDDELERYIEMHKPDDNLSDYMTEATLTRYIIWDSPSLKKNY